MENTKYIGDLSEQFIVVAFLQNGWYPSKPVGDNLRYDLILDRNDELLKIQCKTGSLENGVITFPVCSSYNHAGGGKRDYHGEVDFFAVFCSQTQSVYLIPIKDVGAVKFSMRVEPTKNNQTKNVKFASNYKIWG